MKRGTLLLLASLCVLTACVRVPPAVVAAQHREFSALEACMAKVRQPKLPVSPANMEMLRRYGAELNLCTKRRGIPNSIEPILKVGLDGKQTLERSE